MDKLEKVIKGLELCTEMTQDGCMMLCPYKDEQDETYSGFCEHVLKRDALELLKEQQSTSVDMFIQWCVDSQIMGEATRNGLKYWVDKFKEWKSLKDGDGE